MSLYSMKVRKVQGGLVKAQGSLRGKKLGGYYHTYDRPGTNYILPFNTEIRKSFSSRWFLGFLV